MTVCISYNSDCLNQAQNNKCIDWSYTCEVSIWFENDFASMWNRNCKTVLWMLELKARITSTAGAMQLTSCCYILCSNINAPSVLLGCTEDRTSFSILSPVSQHSSCQRVIWRLWYLNHLWQHHDRWILKHKSAADPASLPKLLIWTRLFNQTCLFPQESAGRTNKWANLKGPLLKFFTLHPTFDNLLWCCVIWANKYSLFCHLN